MTIPELQVVEILIRAIFIFMNGLRPAIVSSWINFIFSVQHMSLIFK